MGGELFEAGMSMVETEHQDQPEVAEVVHIPKSTLQVSLSQAEFPKVEKCCFVFDLKYGLYIWLSIEALIWLFFFISTLIFVIWFASEPDLLEFSDLMQLWHFRMFFGDRFERVDHAIRTYVVLIYLLLTLFFLIYAVFCVIVMIGTKLRKTCYFIPYFTFDVFFFALAFIGCFVGLVISYDHLFRICLIFLIIKTYVEICVVSLFLKIRHEKSKISPTEGIGLVFQDNQATAV